MRHARRDYDRFQDPDGKIPDDEPVFLVRGQDVNGGAIVRDWAAETLVSGGDPVLCERVDAWGEYMDKWCEANGGGKVPDTPSDELRTVEEFGTVSFEITAEAPFVETFGEPLPFGADASVTDVFVAALEAGRELLSQIERYMDGGELTRDRSDGVYHARSGFTNALALYDAVRERVTTEPEA